MGGDHGTGDGSVSNETTQGHDGVFEGGPNSMVEEYGISAGNAALVCVCISIGL